MIIGVALFFFAIVALEKLARWHRRRANRNIYPPKKLSKWKR